MARVAIFLVAAVLVIPWMTAADERAAAEINGEKRQAPAAANSEGNLTAQELVPGLEPQAGMEAAPAAPETVEADRDDNETKEQSAAPAAEPAGIAEPDEPAMDPHEIYNKLAAGDRTGGISPEVDAGTTGYTAPEEPTVYLTFDDGPSRWTPAVLDILQEHEVPATFFVLGQSAEAHADIVQRIVDEGHAIGNHTYNHKYDELYSDFAGFWEQVERTDRILTGLTGREVRLLRAPGGTYTNFDAFYFYYLAQAGYHVHDWTVDSGDSKRRGVPAEEIVSNVRQAKLTHEVNVLLHDSAGHEETVKALPSIIRYYKEQGYRFAVLSESVEPASFRLGPLKWQRDMSEEAHLAALELIQPDDPLRHQTFVAQAESASARRVLAAEEQEGLLAQGWLPLRDWAAALGAAVHWDGQAKTAWLQAGDERLELRTTSGTAIWEGQGRKREPMAAAYRIEQDRLYVKRQEAERMWAMKSTGTLAYQSAVQ